MLRHWTIFIHYYLHLLVHGIPVIAIAEEVEISKVSLNYRSPTQKVEAETLHKYNIIGITLIDFSFRPCIAKKTSLGDSLISSDWGVFGQSSLEFPSLNLFGNPAGGMSLVTPLVTPP